MRLLIVDDDATNLKLLRVQLEAADHEVVEAHDGVDALALLERQPMDAVISDVLMPRMDGYQLCHEIRRSARLRDTPVIIYTSTYTSSDDEKLAFDVGADRYLRKPASLALIRLALDQATVEPVLPRRPTVLREFDVRKEYSEKLVSKLIEKNAELHVQSAALLEAEAKYHSIFDNAIEGLFRTTADGQFLAANPAMARIFGYASAEELMRERTDIGAQGYVVPERRDEFKRRIAAEGFVTDFEYQAWRRDGSEVWVSENARTVRDAGGGTLHYEGSLEDITERKQAEEKLRESEVRLRLAITSTGIGLWDLDVATGHVGYSEEWKTLLGYQGDEVGSSIADWERLTLPEDVALVHASSARYIERPSGLIEAEFRMRHKDGTLRWILSRGMAIELDVDRRASRIIGYHVDITDRKKAEEALLLVNAELEQRVLDRTAALVVANRELEAFSYSVSHDLRAPLRAINGFSRMLESDHAASLSDEGRRLLSVVRANTQRMAMLIDDLLAFSQVGLQELRSGDVDMSALAASVWRDALADDHGSPVELVLGLLPVVQGDASLLRQVWTNLLVNALKFSSRREGRRVEIGGQADGRGVTYFVRDNGVGFDMEYADKLFGVFERLHSNEQFAGTGVGLALVQRIVQRHHGRVWGEGTPGQGASFYFWLPLANDP